ncbi:hypothetical protein PHYBOEH_010038 [Phytophthora boehmeriae]|uniref:Uncharacterized protein n=1 Tax=Phytophthora boehmeriae TaxID=109152 RepID=A0A8T1X4F5_9STRA|nr:hypothetical protein PHYBOEH_010038 [Phytophthora boehmeriae]
MAKVDLNSCSEKELCDALRIRHETAKKIVQLRPFQSSRALLVLPYFTKEKYDIIKENVYAAKAKQDKVYYEKKVIVKTVVVKKSAANPKKSGNSKKTAAPKKVATSTTKQSSSAKKTAATKKSAVSKQSAASKPTGKATKPVASKKLTATRTTGKKKPTVVAQPKEAVKKEEAVYYKPEYPMGPPAFPPGSFFIFPPGYNPNRYYAYHQ